MTTEASADEIAEFLDDFSGFDRVWFLAAEGRGAAECARVFERRGKACEVGFAATFRGGFERLARNDIFRVLVESGAGTLAVGARCDHTIDVGRAGLALRVCHVFSPDSSASKKPALDCRRPAL